MSLKRKAVHVESLRKHIYCFSCRRKRNLKKGKGRNRFSQQRKEEEEEGGKEKEDLYDAEGG